MYKPNKSVSVIMSVFNEENTVKKVLSSLQKLTYITEIIVVDNGSTDNSRSFINESMSEDNRIKLFIIKKNRGLGKAISLAIENTTCEIVARQDADLEYDPEELINLVEVLDKDFADVVYGSRMLVRKAHRVHYYYSYLANIIITMFSNLATNLFLSDVETASKAFNGDIVRKVKWESKGFEIENEMTIKLKKMGCIFYEVPFSYYGRPFSEGKKIRAFDGIKALYYIIFYTIRSFFFKLKK
jgi:glycosyltransferase involved in cell wall biosynthesis